MTAQDDQPPKAKVDRYRRERSDRLDAVLRRIGKVGLDHLNAEEIAYLEQCSDELSLELDTDASAGEASGATA